MSFLKVENLKQSFRSGFFLKPKRVLKGVSFEVKKGSVFGFLGPNGAGKTTLIHVLAGLKKAESGIATISGKNCGEQETKLLVGYLPERPYFYAHLTGDLFLRSLGVLSGMSDAELEKRIPQVLEEVGLSQARYLELKKFSKGMLQRIGIAQAILHNPELLILDEPMSGLDPNGRRRIRDLILKLRDEGKTIFFSTHVVSDVEKLCNEWVILHQGEIVHRGEEASEAVLEKHFEELVNEKD